MRVDSRWGRWCLPRVFFTILLLTPAVSSATQYVVEDRQPMTFDQPGAFVGLTSTSDVVYKGPDPLVTTGGNVFSFAAALDTGASGCVLAAYMAQGRNLPTVPGASFSDVGIGGTETFSVSQPTRVKMASVGIGAQNSESIGYFSSYGDYNLQLRQTDPKINYYGFPDPVYVNVIGTPVLNNYVMHVQPNGATFQYFVDGGVDIGLGPEYKFNVCPVYYLETNLLASAPGYLNVRRSELALVRADNGSVVHVPLNYQDFVPNSPVPPVSTSTNPMIPNVTITRGSTTTPYTSNWLFDTGAAVTMVGRNIATSLGLLNQSVVAQTQVLGIGGDLRTINGYEVESLSVPQTDGSALIFHDIVVFVPGVGDLPADLPGIFGMNLINSSFTQTDELGNPYLPSTSVFSDWYVVPPAMLLPGDANGDGSVNGTDLNVVLSNYNQTGADWIQGDFNRDGSVNGTDLNTLLSHYNQTLGASTAAVPEPSGIVLMLVGCAMCLFGAVMRYRRA